MINWTPELDTRVAELRATGMTFPEIAVEMFGDVTATKAIERRRTRLAEGLAGRFRWTEDALRKLGEMTTDRVPQSAIAAEFGCSVKTIQSRLGKERKKGNPLIPPAYPAIERIPAEKRGGRARNDPKLRAKRQSTAEATTEKRVAVLDAPGYGVPLVDLKHSQCHFSTGFDHETGRRLFCAAETSFGSPWCECHRKIVYVPQPNVGGRIKAKDGRLTEFRRVEERA